MRATFTERLSLILLLLEILHPLVHPENPALIVRMAVLILLILLNLGNPARIDRIKETWRTPLASFFLLDFFFKGMLYFAQQIGAGFTGLNTSRIYTIKQDLQDLHDSQDKDDDARERFLNPAHLLNIVNILLRNTGYE